MRRIYASAVRNGWVTVAAGVIALGTISSAFVLFGQTSADLREAQSAERFGQAGEAILLEAHGHFASAENTTLSSVRIHELSQTVVTLEQADKLCKAEAAALGGVAREEAFCSSIRTLQETTARLIASDTPDPEAFEVAFESALRRRIADTAIRQKVEESKAEALRQTSLRTAFGLIFAGLLFSGILLRGRRAVAKKNRSLSLLAATIEAANEAVISTDLDGTITGWNRGAERMYGFTQEQMLGKSIMSFVPEEQVEGASALMQAVRRGERMEGIEATGVRPDGSTFDTSLSVFPIYDERGAITAIAAIVLDITERKQADAMRSSFLTALSHELRTPLTSLLGFARSMQQHGDALDAETRAECITRIISGGEKLEKLIADLLDLDRLGRGTLQPRRSEVNLRTLIDDVAGRIDAGPRTVVIEVASDLWAEIDQSQAERMLEALLHNAVRYTPKNSRIWMRAVPREVGIRLIVDDDGPGVPQDLRTVIFEPLRQGRNISSHSPGAGVGLSLVARLAEMHGGRAWVDERPGGGASFNVYLPARVSRAGRTDAVASVP
jgi:PAS domain S-box-containing protein